MRLSTFLQLRCPVCENARIFNGYFDTPKRCPACGYYFMREAGYFLPHVPIGYGATVLVSISMWPILRYGFGVRSDNGIIIGMVAAGIIFGAWFLRYAKMLWLLIDLKLHPKSTEDFESRGRGAKGK
jgi:hypothetical protein